MQNERTNDIINGQKAIVQHHRATLLTVANVVELFACDLLLFVKRETENLIRIKNKNKTKIKKCY